MPFCVILILYICAYVRENIEGGYYMKYRRTSRFLSIVLLIAMVLTLMPTVALAEDTTTTSTWTQIDLKDVQSSDTVAITMSKDGNTWLLPNSAENQPLAVAATVDGNVLTAPGTENDFGWNIVRDEESFVISGPNGSLYIRGDKKNNGVRIGEIPAVWTIDAKEGLPTTADQANVTRYMGVYSDSNGSDWRAYEKKNDTVANVSGQTFGVWKLNESGTIDPVDPPEPPVDPDDPAETASFVKLDAAPADGDKVVIYNPASSVVMGLEDYLYNNTKHELTPVAATLGEDGKLTPSEGYAYLTVKLSEDGKYSFINQDGKFLEVDGTHVQFVETESANTLFQLEEADGGYYVKCDTAAYNGNAQYLQYYHDYFTVYSMNTNAPERYVFAFYGEAATQPEEPVETTALARLEAAPADGDKVVIYNPASSVVMGLEDYLYNNTKHELTPVAATLGEDGKLTPSEGYAYLTVKLSEDGKYSFINQDGKFLEVDGTHVQFVETESANTLFQLEEADGGYYVKCDTAAYNGNAQYLQYYHDYFTVYSMNTNAPERYVFAFYGETANAPVDPYAGIDKDLNVYQLTDAIQAGDKVLIYNAGNKKAAAGEMSGYYLAGKNETVLADTDLIATKDEKIEWTVVVNEDGSYGFVQEGVTLAGKQTPKTESGYYNNVSLSASDMAAWILTKVSDSGSAYYIYNRDMITAFESDDGHVYLEWYAKNTAFSLYDTSRISENNFGFTFYKLVRAAETPDDPTPEEATYGLVDKDSLQTGDKVILFNAGYSKGVSSSVISSNYLAGVELVPAENVITTDDAAVVWEVTVNADGTYTFTNGSNTLGGTQTTNESNGKTYNNINLSNPAASAWTAEAANTANAYYLYLGDLPSSKENGHIYMDWFDKYSEFSLNDYANPGTNSAYVFSFYKQGAEPVVEPEETGDLVTSLSQLTDGATVAIYSPGHKTAISSKPNGDWYLKANAATVENGKVVNFTSDFVWKVQKNADGTFTFVSFDEPANSITVWLNDKYAEVTVNHAKYAENGDNTWTLTPAATANCFYMSSPTISGTSGPAYIEAYVRNEFEVFSGYFTKPTSNQFVENEFALQFYLLDPTDAIAAYDDGEWDGVLEKGSRYVLYNEAAESSLGLYKAAEYAFDAISTTVANGLADPGNGAYVFTVDSMGRYYSFMTNGKFLATNDSEELLLVDPLEDGSAPEAAKWFLTPKTGGYIIYNKECTYNGTPVCIEYYSSVFSGWTFSPKNELNIYLFNFYPVVEGIDIRDDMVQKPYVKFDSNMKDSRCIGQDYAVEFALLDMAPEIGEIRASVTVNGIETPVQEMLFNRSTKEGSFTLSHELLDAQDSSESFTLTITVTNSYGITYTGTKTVEVKDEPFFEQLSPAPNAQTGEDKRPLISAYVGNVGEDPVFVMTLNDEAVTPTYDPETKILSYQPAADLADGRVTVSISVTRADGVEGEKSWSFTVGNSTYQLYFGQLHSHTTYSDGSGSLDTALEYIDALPESANIQFVAFTDHSNYFDSASAANPADALNDKSLMTEASREKWNTYKNTIARFNEDESHDKLVAIGGFEMTWSGGPGHINTFASDGLVSRNNAELNNKSGDAGMKLYYETINKGESLNQFNHPGATFGNFTDFSYRDEATDAHMFLVEVGNGEGQIGAGGYYPSYEQYIMALDKGWHVAPTNNQDNHKGRWGNANDARDVVLAETLTEQAIYDAIRSLRVYATEDKNLQLNYTVNGEPMGTIFEEAPDTVNVSVTMYDPDDSDRVQKVELVANSGIVAYTWNDAEELAEGALSAELQPTYGYYFVRVTQADGDLAVTAPVWLGQGVKIGIESFTCPVEHPLVNRETTLTTKLFNNEASAVTVKSVVYTTKGGVVIGSDTAARTVPAGGTLEIPFAYTPDVAKRMTITATVIFSVNGVDYTYTKDLTFVVRLNDGPLPLSPISAVQAQTEAEYEYAIEGVVTSNASGIDKDTAFFDCIYVQDETAGVCCFPVSGEFKIGDKLHIEGYTDFYQGEMELQVEKIEKIGVADPVQPTEVTAAQINDRSYLGSLVTLKGTVESFEYENGLIQTIMVKDANGDVARVFIDGYITIDEDVKNLSEGCRIEVTGLSSYDDTWKDTGYFPRIRVRDRADVICTSDLAPVPTFEKHSLTLSGAIAVNFFLNLPEIEGVDWNDSYMIFTLSGKELRVDYNENYKNQSGEFYGFDCPTNSVQMAEPITAVFHYGDGLTVSEQYSVKQYIELFQANENLFNAKQRALIRSIADYGHYAQPFLAAANNWVVGEKFAEMDLYYTDSYDIDAVKAAVADYAIVRETSKEITKINYSLALDSGTDIRVIFTPAEGYSGSLSFTVDGNPAEATLRSDGRYMVVIPAISAHKLGDTHVVTATTDNGTATAKVSALSYVQGMLANSPDAATANAMAALYSYYKAAVDYRS